VPRNGERTAGLNQIEGDIDHEEEPPTVYIAPRKPKL
jgi:hypothetical protein